jgi:hypothetical protein
LDSLLIDEIPDHLDRRNAQRRNDKVHNDKPVDFLPDFRFPALEPTALADPVDHQHAHDHELHEKVAQQVDVQVDAQRGVVLGAERKHFQTVFEELFPSTY